MLARHVSILYARAAATATRKFSPAVRNTMNDNAKGRRKQTDTSPPKCFSRSTQVLGLASRLNPLAKRFNLIEVKHKSNWQYPACCCKQSKSGNTNTLVRPCNVDTSEDDGQSNEILRTKKKDERSLDSVDDHHSDSISFVKKHGESRLTQDMELFRSEIAAMRQISNISSYFEKLSYAVEGLNNRKYRVQVLGGYSSAVSASSDLKVLVDTRDRLKLELNERDQEILSTEVEITGLPETNNENPVYLAIMVAQKLGVERGVEI
ncbi:hypothetical protein EVAR_25908_1 [Eumeta japonica]|uniref:Uncharacterized protein n=1 Tax=Eumeta variegata TaxID=151549 RepID=A0A4C1W3T2_EUMVA|nr:hypothetical protein EVAR_25908_1 [Eumeta japonica]